MNRIHKNMLILLGLCAVVLLPNLVCAQDDFSALYNRFLFHDIGQSARSAAMGGVYSALQGGDMAFFGNPASLGFQTDRYIGLDGVFEQISSERAPDRYLSGINNPIDSSAFAETDIWNVGGGIAYPFDWGGLALNYGYRNDETDSDPYRVSQIFNYDIESEVDRHLVSLSGGYKVQDNLSLGYRYSYIDISESYDIDFFVNNTFSQTVSDGYDFEGHRNQIGLQYFVNEDLIFGLDGIYGFGEQDNGNDDDDADSWGIRGGFAWKPTEQYPLLVAFDANYENREYEGGIATDEDHWGLHLGAEYEVNENVFLRVGYQLREFDLDTDLNPGGFNSDPTISSYSAGLGYIYEQFSFDYGFVYSDTGDNGDIGNFLSIGYRF